MERPHFKYKKDLIYESKTNQYICRYINYNNEIIDFIKIDAEGKDFDITKSLKPYFSRIKYIGVECSSHTNNNLSIFGNGSSSRDVLSFFKENNFDIFEITDYSIKSDNLTQMSDIIFINNNHKLP